MTVQPAAFHQWRASLLRFLGWFETLRKTTRLFYVKAFAVFVLLNLSCYWLALLTAYPGHVFGAKAIEYVLMGFPVGVLGALFDCASLLVTLWIVRRALGAQDNASYVLYLSIDLLIAMVASLWVLFVFTASGWIVSYMLAIPESMGSRVWLYEQRVESALFNPLDPNNLRNIFFGLVMGASALLPTLLHAYLACQAFARSGAARLGFTRSNP